MEPKVGDMFSGGDTTKYKENLIKLEIYYEEFNFEVVSERPTYPVRIGLTIILHTNISG